MNLIRLTELAPEQKVSVFKLWKTEYPVTLSFRTIKDMDDFMDVLLDKEYLLCVDDNGVLMAWMGLFTREDERWFSILVDSEHQGKGLGKMLLDEAKKIEDSLNGWVLDHNRDKKVDGDPYYSPLSFYLKNEFDVYPDTRYEQNGVSALKINWTKE